MITLQSTDTQLQQLAQAEDSARESSTTVRVDRAALRALLRDHYTLCTARGVPLRFNPPGRPGEPAMTDIRQLVDVRRIDGIYDVYIKANGQLIGEIYRDDPPTVWSYARWVIFNDPRKAAGGVRGSQTRRYGYSKLSDAVYDLAIQNSAAIVRAQP